MHVLIVPFGSHGDVHPLIGLGLALRERGHRVTFLVHEYFGPLVRGEGFEVVPIGAEYDFQAALRDPNLWHPTRAIVTVGATIPGPSREVYRRIEERYVPGETVAVGGTLAFGVRLAQEKLGIPAATVHLQPGVLHSNHKTPVYGGKSFDRLPTWFKRLFFELVYSRMVNPHIVPGLNVVRAEIGLPPVRDVFREWCHSPELVLGFFPAWFGPPQPDWPPDVRLVGFPLYDERDTTPIPPELDAFLAEGPLPIAFTPGSANLFGRPFFDAAADACKRLGRRGILLTRFAEQLPADLPEGVRHFPYAPFSLLLPRVAALAHHGGVGSSAQAMAAGVPQLVMPLAHDQFDNAARMQRLGVARSIRLARFRGPAVASALKVLLDSPEVAKSCREVAIRFVEDGRPMERASEAIEALGRGTLVHA
jgi:rhamnosyltransferase subunit B